MINLPKSKRNPFLFYYALFMMLFSGCVTEGCPPPPPPDEKPPVQHQYRIIPITDAIITEVGGLEKAEGFQYYISKAITLKRNNTAPKGDVVNGELVRTIFTNRDTIRIEANTPGLVRAHPQRRDDASLGNALNVAFENIQGSPYIAFGKWPPLGIGSNGRYQILYSDAANLIINYGGIEYDVS